jgi:hypothetical protein
MENFQRFIQIGADRINATEIVSYGIATDEDDDTYLYVETKTSEDLFQYYGEDVDFDLEEKISELDSLFLIRKLGHVNFERN